MSFPIFFILPFEIKTSTFLSIPSFSLVQAVTFLKTMFEYFGFSLKPYAVFGKVTGKTGNFFFGSILLRTSSFNSSSFFALDSRSPNVFISSEDNPLNLAMFFNSSIE